MKGPELASLQKLIGTLADRYGEEKLEHLNAQHGSQPSDGKSSSGPSYTSVFAEAIATMALAESINQLTAAVKENTDAIYAPDERKGVLDLPEGPVRMTVIGRRLRNGKYERKGTLHLPEGDEKMDEPIFREDRH